jgi:hypothetical protein
MLTDNYPSFQREGSTGTQMAAYLHSAPPESIIHQMSETIGNVSSLQKMGLLWHLIVLEVGC